MIYFVTGVLLGLILGVILLASGEADKAEKGLHVVYRGVIYRYTKVGITD